MIGTFLVQKRMSLIGDGIGHLAFAGVAAGLLLGVWPVWTALAVAVVGRAGGRMAPRRGARPRATWRWPCSSTRGWRSAWSWWGWPDRSTRACSRYLFGAILTVSPGELLAVVILGVVIVVVMTLVRGAMFAVVSDEEWARVAGLPVDLLNGLLAVITACAIVTAMRVVGILLVAALMVLPVASGQLLARSFRGTLGGPSSSARRRSWWAWCAPGSGGWRPAAPSSWWPRRVFALVGIVGGRRSAERSLRALAVVTGREAERRGAERRDPAPPRAEGSEAVSDVVLSDSQPPGTVGDVAPDLHVVAASRLRPLGQRYTPNRRALVEVLDAARASRWPCTTSWPSARTCRRAPRTATSWSWRRRGSCAASRAATSSPDSSWPRT